MAQAAVQWLYLMEFQEVGYTSHHWDLTNCESYLVSNLEAVSICYL